MTNRIDLDPARISLYQRRLVPHSDHRPMSGRPFFAGRLASLRSLPRQLFRNQMARVGSGERPRRGNLRCRRILCNQSSGFCLDSQVPIQSRLEFWVRIIKAATKYKPALISFWRPLVLVRPGRGNPLEGRLAIRDQAQGQRRPRPICRPFRPISVG
jgi:hypothetical protein